MFNASLFMFILPHFHDPLPLSPPFFSSSMMTGSSLTAKSQWRWRDVTPATWMELEYGVDGRS